MALDEIKSRDFIIALGKALIQPELERRKNMLGMNREMREAIAKVCNISCIKYEPEEEDDEEPAVKKRRRCYFCPRGKDNKCTTFCNKCKKPACRSCLKTACADCFNNTVL